MDYIRAFLVGGTICLIGQILMEKTKLTSARILVIFVTAGVILGAVGVYKPIAEFGRAGASIPLTGFGYSLARGAIEEVQKNGIIGAFTGGIKAASAGMAAAVFFGYIMALIFKPRTKN
ncbi:stage V sporulation protein AE [Fonticella tunisiensis]|uniref:Stage V sporulation protein AE n=1 Tax=Fonticella tunisiensis TaxID=1096341 RepID=A0A4R7KB89_9CLOT|nr:stage V sporulation protein AE [Fonticella tunisiensis]TDT50796.1 stage V sporulation protein AE [Fonticella tunisiensis]